MPRRPSGNDKQIAIRFNPVLIDRLNTLSDKLFPGVRLTTSDLVRLAVSHFVRVNDVPAVLAKDSSGPKSRRKTTKSR